MQRDASRGTEPVADSSKPEPPRAGTRSFCGPSFLTGCRFDNQQDIHVRGGGYDYDRFATNCTHLPPRVTSYANHILILTFDLAMPM